MPQQRLGGQVGAQLVQAAGVAGLAHRPGQLLDPVRDGDHLLGAGAQLEPAHPVLGQLRVQAAAGPGGGAAPDRRGRVLEGLEHPGQPGPDQRVARAGAVRQRGPAPAR